MMLALLLLSAAPCQIDLLDAGAGAAGVRVLEVRLSGIPVGHRGKAVSPRKTSAAYLSKTCSGFDRMIEARTGVEPEPLTWKSPYGITVAAGQDAAPTALEAALASGSAQDLAAALKSGADANASGRLGAPLCAALVLRHREQASALLEAGARADANCAGFSGPGTPLTAAAAASDAEMVRDLLRRGAESKDGQALLSALDPAGTGSSSFGRQSLVVVSAGRAPCSRSSFALTRSPA